VARTLTQRAKFPTAFLFVSFFFAHHAVKEKAENAWERQTICHKTLKQQKNWRHMAPIHLKRAENSLPF